MRKLAVVGIGPGNYENMTIRADRALRECDVIVGYTVYVDLVKERYADKEFLTTPMLREVERCEMALETARGGKTVAMICSGDSGIYGMAALLYELRGEAAEALGQMFKAAEEEAGLKLYVKSAYRSYQTQSTMYDSRLSRNGKDDGVVAFPGSSDHQTGLGVDLLNYDWTRREGMTAAFGETQEAKWMEENAARFGYTLRYMPEKQEITGIIYEPWHFRYVGREAAAYMMDNRLTLEEFTQESNAAIKDYESRGGDFAALCRELNAPPAPIMLDETDEEGDGEVSLFYPKP